MSNTDNTLPEELQKEIDDAACEKTMKMPSNNSFDIGYSQGYESGYIAGATEYAHWKIAFEGIEDALREQKEATDRMREAYDNLGREHQQAKQIVKRMFQRGEYLFDPELSNEIKSFLDGSK